MRKIRKIDLMIILLVAIVFAVITVTNTRLIVRSMVDQTQQIGQTQISSIKTDYENYIATAENSLIRVASGAEQLMAAGDDKTALENYIISQKQAQFDASNGTNFNVYIAGPGWEIIPDFDVPDDYHGTERSWYIGALESAGNIYITDPYMDSMTGEMCYTLSVLLSDGETVVGMDFTFSEIQQSIEKMSLSEGSVAMIVTSGGLIVGYSDMSYVGRELKKSLPDYGSMFDSVLEKTRDESFTMKIKSDLNTVFHSVTKNNWYMILCVNNNKLYSTVKKQVAVNIITNVAMLVLIIILYVYGVRSRIRIEEEQAGREVFIESLLEKIKEPLRNIIKTSDKGGEEGRTSLEDYASIKASGVRIKEIMRDLSSYSSIVSNLEKTEKEKQKEIKSVSGSIPIFRNIIVALLILVMVVSSYLYFDSGTDTVSNSMDVYRDQYGYRLSEWEQEQFAVLGMFTNMIASKPELVSDYDEAVAWMDSVAKNYPSISVCYLANPYNEHTVIMNNGWQPDEDWKVEERDWYRETEKSADGRNVSDPYYDEQTGNYCITISQMVYGKNGEFLGIFGIDLYMDKIIKVFGESYTSQGYAFLVDPNGDIINHPNEEYQMSQSGKVNISDTPYANVYEGDGTDVQSIRDYNGSKMVCLKLDDKETGFSVVIAWSWFDAYFKILVYTTIYIAVILAIIILIIVLINKVIKSQASMNGKLAQAVKDAEAAGQAKSDFLAQMSHEIRTPINAVIGMDEMILRESGDPEILEYARDIRSASKTLLTLINGILDFSKIESGNMDIVPVKYETAGLVDDLVNMISDKAEKKGLELKLEIDEKLPRELFGDDVRIRQVITNLLSNAVKYTEKGTVTLTLRADRVTDRECELFVDVSDTGMGIKEEDMENLFRSFKRLDEQKNRTIEGTGLGMSIVQGLLKLMGSSLEVHSKYGIGSSFSFRITQSVIDKTPLGEYRKNLIADTDSGEQKNMRITKADILVVDDNVMNLKVVRGLMKRLQTVPDLAGSGREAISMIENKHYDIVLMDHMMPEMDGIETLKELRSRSLIDDSTAVIALTANAIAGAREMYLAEGFRGYLSKPIDPELLEQTFAEYLPEGSYTYTDGADKPAEAVRESKEESELKDEPDKKKDPMEDALRKNGFNVDAALVYTMNDIEFYGELLGTFIKSSVQMRKEIKEFYESENWDEYKTKVHALKSAARTIGADQLSELALVHENAAREYDVKTIKEGYDDLMALYAQTVDVLTGITDESAEQSELNEDESERFDFFPV